jgi:poly-gamma-glutamate capsule biosynthesis protein CapA/YwtB (metallophosphatase superfamily)
MSHQDRIGGDKANPDITIFLGGDVMIGRGIDQVLPNPSDPRLYEEYVTSALDYVALAEAANGPIPRRAGYAYVWGEALAELERVRPDARIVNLETSVTSSSTPEPKGINYRMHPKNVACLVAAGLDCCVLANNHILDWGLAGLEETLGVLSANKLGTAGGGRNLDEAAAPAVIDIEGKGRVIVFAFGSTTSGISRSWAATAERAGINLLTDLSARAVDDVAKRLRAARQPGDLIVASLHWGENWGHEISREQRDFAHGLIDVAGADIVHGHSSHHPKAIEIHRGKPILYGCGDLLNDYEGIAGHEAYRGELALMYFLTVDGATGRLARLEMTPLRIRKFQLHRASREDARWLCDTLDRECAKFGGGVDLGADDRLRLKLDSSSSVANFTGWTARPAPARQPTFGPGGLSRSPSRA